MTKAKRKLIKVNVNFISLVHKGANQKTIIYKSETNSEDNQPTYTHHIDIKKTNQDEQMIYGIVYSPDEVDSQGDIATRDTIKEMAYQFMKSKNIANVDKQHNEQTGEGFVVESWLIKSGDPTFPLEKEGSWAVAIKVENPETWELVKSGEITGLSLAGEALVEEVKEKSFIEKVFDFFKSSEPVEKAGKVFNKKNLQHLKDMKLQLEGLIAQAEKEVETEKEINQDLTKSEGENIMNENEVKELVEKAIAPLNEKIESLEKSITEKDAKIEEVTKAKDELAVRLETVEKSTNGSNQVIETAKAENKVGNIWT